MPTDRTIRHRRAVLSIVIGLIVAMTTGAGLAHAGTTAPIIDGNGDDLIAFAAGLSGANCGIEIDDVRDDVSIADLELVPCAPKEDTDGNGVPDYFPNGFDLRRLVVAYDRASQNLYILWRTEGAIGDPDGNGSPDDALCAPALPTFPDEPGVGAQDFYQARFDTNCDGAPDLLVTVGGGLEPDRVRVEGLANSGVQFAYRAVGSASGKDLEMRISGVALPVGFRAKGNVNSSFDGLSEDVSLELGCDVSPSISLEKSVNVASICPGGTADFTLLVTNNGDVPLTNVTLVDELPAGLIYEQTVSNTCGGAVNAVGNTITYGPFELAAGASCTVVLRVGRTAECSGEQVNNASVEGIFQSPCLNGGQAYVPGDKASISVACGSIQCSISAPDTRVCGSETVQICGPEGNYTYEWSTGATTRCIDVGAGTYSLTVSDKASGCRSTNPCSVTIEQDTPLIEVTKSVAPEGPVEQGGLLTYTITVTNPANSTITAQSIQVRDELCDEVLYANNANLVPDKAPDVGQTGTIFWTVGPLAPGTSATITFDARIRELSAPECEAPDLACTNVVRVATACGDKEVTDEDSVTTPIPGCEPGGLCRLTGGGCLNEEGSQRGRKQNTFGGNSSPLHDGGGPTGNSWEHVLRNGKEIEFNWHSWDAHVVQCSVVEPGPCHPAAENTRADFEGTGKYSIGAGGREADGNMVAWIVDHREGSCNRDDRDEYFITVRSGLVIGEGEVVFEVGGEIDCGNLQIHETPARLFGNDTQQPGEVSEIQSVALLNRAVPNPFRSSMSYSYEIVGADQAVEIGVYNVAGRLVKSLVSTTLPAGRHTATWNGTDNGGARAPSGVYFVRARYGAELKQQRVIYLGQ